MAHDPMTQHNQTTDQAMAGEQMTLPAYPIDSDEMHRRIAQAHRLRSLFIRDAVQGLLRRLHLARASGAASPRPAGMGAARA